MARSLISFVLTGLLLFLPSGRWAWPQAWIFLLLFASCSVAIGVWLRRTDPALLAERTKSPLSRDQRPGDRALMAAISAGFFLWLALIGLDARFRWSHLPVWLEAIGAIGVVAAFAGFAQVLRANSFASVTVRVQHERRQKVVSTGPYAVVRHPMYSYALVLMVGSSLLLGSAWGLVCVLPLLVLIGRRALGEEAVLIAGLGGYRDYVGRVRFRLIPGIW